MPLDLDQLRFERLGVRRALCLAVIPQFLEHPARHGKKLFAWRQGLQERLELAFDGRPLDRLAVALTAAFEAVIIRMAVQLAFRPAGGQRRGAVGAGNESAQGEVLADILAARRIGTDALALLYLLVGRKADKPFMLAGPKRHAPCRGFDVPGIDGLVEQNVHALMAHDLSARVLREQRMFRQEARHVGLLLEAARGKTFERFANDRGHGFVGLEHLASARDALVFVAHRRLKHEVAVHDAGAHAVLCLLRILAALVLGDGREDVFVQFGIGVLAELDAGRLQYAARK